jgi:hypothetical protein
MVLVRSVAFCAGLIASSLSQARDPVELKSIPLDSFMQNSLAVSIPLSIPVPVAYEAATLRGSPVGYSYWMNPQDAKSVEKTGDLPAKNGYMYGKVSLDVGYDKSKDIFIGAEDPQSIEKAKTVFSDVKIERLKVADHAVLLVTMSQKQTGKFAYAMYVATGIDTNTVYVAFRPAGNSGEIGEFVWSALRQKLGSN